MPLAPKVRLSANIVNETVFANIVDKTVRFMFFVKFFIVFLREAVSASYLRRRKWKLEPDEVCEKGDGLLIILICRRISGPRWSI